MNGPKISIIIPTLNSSDHLNDCLESIVRQSYQNMEVLLIDGLSTDNTPDIAKTYTEKYNYIKFISGKDYGIYDAMNKGIKIAKGEWLYFMGSDDILFDNVVLSKVFTLKIDSLQVVYGNVLFKHSHKFYDNKFNWYKLLQRNICHQAIFYKSTIFKQLGFYNTKYKMLADWEFNFRWFNKYSIKRKYLDQIFAVYNEDGACFNNPDIAFNEDIGQIIRTHLSHLRQILWKYSNKKIINKTLSTLYNK